MRRLILTLACLTALTGCATVEGLGNDISAGANKVRNVF